MSPKYLKHDLEQQQALFAKLLDELKINEIIVTEDMLRKKIKILRNHAYQGLNLGSRCVNTE